MAINLTQLENDVRYMMADLPQTIIFNGNSYQAIVGDAVQGADEPLLAGFDPRANLNAVIITSDFSVDRPDTGDVIEYQGNKYRVVSISYSPCGTTATLWLENAQ